MKKKLIKIAGYLITAAAFLYLIKAIIDKHPDFTKISNPPGAWLLGLLITVCFAAIVYVSAFAWKAVLEFIQGGRIYEGSLTSVYARANIAKYLPGNFMHFAGRNVLAGKLGFTQLDIAFSTLVEVGMLLITACLWALVLAFKYFVSILRRAFGLFYTHRILSVVFVILFLAAIGVFLYLIVKKAYFKKYRKFFTLAFLKLAGRLFLIYSLTLLVPAISFVALLAVVFGCSMTPHIALLTAAAYITSWVAGYLVLGAPGGIGVRESVLLLILGSSFPSEILLAAIIFHRILSVIGDAAAFFFDYGKTRLHKTGPEKPAD